MNRTAPALILIAAFCIAIPRVSVSAGYYFESTTTSEGEGMGRRGQVLGVRAWVDGPNAKVEFEDSDQEGFFQEGAYLLSRDAGETVYLVNPAEMTYAELNLDEMMGMLGNIMSATQGIVEVEFSDFANEKLAEEPGEAILGYPTTRYEYRTGYTMRVGVLGFGQSNRSESHQELWCTDELDAGGFGVWLSPDRFRTGMEELDEFIQSQYQGLDCLPLRTRVTTTSGEGRRSSSTVSTTEVTQIREEASIDPSTFELPDGYAATQLVPELPQNLSQSQNPGEQGQPQSQEEEESGPLRRLRDLVR